MPRSYGNINVGIWRDADFCALSPGAQRTYFMLVTQPDITACGTLALTVRRWSTTVPAEHRATFRAWLIELEIGRFTVVDEDTEELLVRSFAKWDSGGYKNPKRLRAITDTAEAIRSGKLRAALALELVKLDIQDCPSKTIGWPIDSPSIPNPASESGAGMLTDDLPKGDRSPSDSPRSAVTLVSTPTEPHSGTVNRTPEPLAPDKPDADEKPGRPPDPVWDALLAACDVQGSITDSARGAYNRAVRDLKAADATPGQITLRARKFVQKWPDVSLTPTALARRWPELNGTPHQARRFEQ